MIDCKNKGLPKSTKFWHLCTVVQWYQTGNTQS